MRKKKVAKKWWKKKTKNHISPALSILIQMSYTEFVKYLLKKHGEVSGDYYIFSYKNNLFQYHKNNKITRSKDGLQIHHIDEFMMPMLSHRSSMRTLIGRFAQSQERLVYADLLEHLLLHIKIYQESLKYGINNGVGYGGIYLISTLSINGYYKNKPNSSWHKNMYDKIADSLDDYIILLLLWFYIAKPEHLSILFVETPSKPPQPPKMIRFKSVITRMACCYDGTLNEEILANVEKILKKHPDLEFLIQEKNIEANRLFDNAMEYIKAHN